MLRRKIALGLSLLLAFTAGLSCLGSEESATADATGIDRPVADSDSGKSAETEKAGAKTAPARNNPLDAVLDPKRKVKWEEITHPETGKTGVKAGSCCMPVVLSSAINSKTGKKGDPIAGILGKDFVVGARVIALQGATISGVLADAAKARMKLDADTAFTRWGQADGMLVLRFEQLEGDPATGTVLKMSTRLPPGTRLMERSGKRSIYGVNKRGEITMPAAAGIKDAVADGAVTAGLYAVDPSGTLSAVNTVLSEFDSGKDIELVAGDTVLVEFDTDFFP